MRARIARTALLAASLLCLLAPPAGAAADKSVAEEILDILRAQGQISEQQYRELRERARSEVEAARTPAVAADGDRWKTYWKNGLRVESPDDQFQIKIGGRLQTDWAYFDADDEVVDFFGDEDLDGGSGTEFRRARLSVEGLLYERIKFKVQYEFAGQDADPKDAYVELIKVPTLGSIRLGHFKEPFGLEELTSSNYITFVERSIATEAFSPSRNSGFFVHNHAFDKRMNWALGAFRQTDDAGFDFGKDEIWNVTGRLAGVPWYENEGEKLLHVGLSYTHRFSDGEIRFQARPEAHLSPVRYVDTDSFAADDVDLINPELALVWGPFSLQGEYFRAFIDSDVGDDPDFDGFYAEASYFLTGEHRRYKLGAGAFDRVNPKRNFDLEGGLGAWQLAVRYSSVDLTDGDVDGGELDNVTVGLNWHLNPAVRLMFNYVWADLQDVDSTNILQSRVQLDF